MIAWLTRPLFRLLVRLTPDGDPWERIGVAPKLNLFGCGAHLDFPGYLSGPSTVLVHSIVEIQDWLLGCRYERDEVLFGEADFWQHPATFERLRAGDCDDFALWTWRKLGELGIDADIVAGYCLKDGKLGGRHVWVVFRNDGVESVFEPTCSSRQGMIRPLSEARDEYVPEVGADRNGHRFGFTGYMLAQKRRLRRASSSSA